MQLPRIFFCLKLPARIAGGRVELKRLRPADGPFLHAIIAGTGLRGERGKAVVSSWIEGLAAWWWARNTYICSYTIRTGGRRIGLIGVYGLERGSVELSLVLDDKDRDKGYGRESYRLLADRLAGTCAISCLRVRVDASNARALSFWRHADFRISAAGHDCLTLSRNLTSALSAPVSSYPCG